MTESVKEIASRVTAKYGVNRCKPCAEELRDELKKASHNGSILQMKTNGGRGFIVMKDPNFPLPFPVEENGAISETGLHFGVEVGGTVYGNIFRVGTSRSNWENSFDCDVHVFTVTEFERF